MNKKELWLNLKAYRFEHVVPPHLWQYISQAFGGADASTKAFAGKIARKTGWTNKFALKALMEYKKFVFLGVVSDFNVTPSKIIDRVWHEHILFSKAYRQFCSEVIDCTFDHNPELFAMADQTDDFTVQYLNTIALYKTEFGIDPPSDIWSVPKFDQEKTVDDFESIEKRKKNNDARNKNYPDAALFSLFDGSAQQGNASEAFPEFAGFGGGDTGGGGASGSWDSNNSSSDSGSGDGGSGCSSSCGGGD